LTIDPIAFVFGASSGLTQGPHFKGVSLGELGEIEPQHAHNIDRGAWLDDYGKEAKA